MFGESVIKVNGMSCAHCEKRVETAVAAVNGVKSCKASAKSGSLKFSCGKDEAVVAAVKKAVADAGYTVSE